MEIETLVARCQEGDEVAWEALVRQLQGRVFAFCYHYLRDREEARDMAQETFIRIYRALPRFRREGSFLAWTLTIARNACHDRGERLRRTAAYGAEPVEEPGAIQHAAPEESHVDRQARHQLLELAIDDLSPNSREMILLKEIQGLQLKEIAAMLGIPLGTVKTRSHRARLELADRMLELDPSYGARP